MPLTTGGRRYRRRKKEEVFIEGYFVDGAIDLAPGLDRQDETFHRYGNDQPELDVQHNFGTLSMTVMDQFTNNEVLAVITGQAPATTAQYRVEDLVTAHAWANVKDQKNTKYIKSTFYPGWAAGLPLPSGDPNAKAQFVISGNCGLPRHFEGLWIKAKKLASGASPSLGENPVGVPGESGIYAVAVKALNIVGGQVDQEEVIPSAAMVLSNGDVSFVEIEAQVSELADVTHAYIYYLQSGTGVYPNVKPDKLYA